MPETEQLLESFDEIIFTHMNRIPEYPLIREELAKFLDQYIIIEKQPEDKE